LVTVLRRHTQAGLMLGALRERLKSRSVRIVVVAVLALTAAGVVAGALSQSSPVSSHSQFVPGTAEAGAPVRLDTTLFLPSSTPAPAILLSQGFGGDKSSLAGEATTFAQQGYVVLTYSARGFGTSGGKIHFASPDYEVKDASLLVSYLAGLPQVEKVGDTPQIAAAGGSYGGGLSLLLAAADHRVRAVAADITWNDLSHAFFPNAAGSAPGPFKRLWVGSLFGNGFGDPTSALAQIAAGRQPDVNSTSVSCGNFSADVCSAYQDSARTGRPTSALTAIVEAASPATYLSEIDAPTLLTQGEQDSLFPLSEADANARGLAAHDTPVRVVWRQGGHDDASMGSGTVTSAALSWFGSTLGRGARVAATQPFEFSEQAGVISAATGSAEPQVFSATGYPGVAGQPQAATRTVTMNGPPQPVASPAGGAPAAITSIPGLGGLLSQLGGVAGSRASLPTAPGQTASFASPVLQSEVRIVGSSSVRLTVTAQTSGDVVLFAGLRDLSADGSDTLPSSLVSPLRITGVQADVPTTVTVALPSIVRNVLAGHRLALTISTTDFAYANETMPRTYQVALAGGTSTAVTIPTLSGATVGGGHPITWLIVGLVVCAVVALGVTAVFLRRRLVLKSVPELAHIPVSIEHLVKEYRGGYRAVNDVSFRVERGQVVGLLGPNGAGKTTTLRTLVGLITPTSGLIHVFGEPVMPGAPVLARLGSFIEGPGFLPHLTGRENLRLYWAATGRPTSEAEFGVALDIAGLNGSIDRRVRNYSHGMRQRLGIAQAMLGLPELLVLDEPTNGLDPPQIAEMREVLQQYAETGRTVIVSSHLLAEVEQTCTHVMVMHRGRLIASGSVDDVVAGEVGQQLAVDDPTKATKVLAAAGISVQVVPARRALEDVFLDLIGSDES